MAETQVDRYTGPDRNTQPAKFKPPPHACDSHAHLYGPVARFPYPPGTEPPPDAPFEDYARMHEVLGIERGVFSQSSQYKNDNRVVLDALERGAPHLRAIIRLDAEELTDSVVARMDAKGARGIRFHKEEFDQLEETSRRIAGAGWRVEIVPPSIDALIALRPVFERMKCAIVIDQMGLPDASEGVDHPSFQTVLAMVREGSIWVKLSHPYHVSRQGPPYADVLPFARALVKANPGRCVWGTNWPHGQKKWPAHWERPKDGMLLDLLVEWIPDEATRNRILVDNPAKLNRF